MIKEIHIEQRVQKLRMLAAVKYSLRPEQCHLGHIVLQGILEQPNKKHQIDVLTGQSETNASVAFRSTKLASAMKNYGLHVGDHVVVMGNNHLDLCIPYYACNYNGYSMCAVDPSMIAADIQTLFQYIQPRMIFCPSHKVEDLKQGLEANDNRNCHIVIFDNIGSDLEAFSNDNRGTAENFVPAIIDQEKTICWLMLTSGTTGLPKVAIIPFKTLLDGLCAWWSPFTEQFETTLAMATIQWMSSLIFFISTPLMRFVRLQCSAPITPPLLVQTINKYRPNVTAWTPYLLGQFLQAAGNLCNLTCYKYIAIGGSSVEKPLYDAFQEKCGDNTYLYLVYGMTELLVPVFDFNKTTPFGSTGKPCKQFQYRLIDDDGNDVTEPNKNGELWLKGDAFFKGYLNNPEETNKILTKDGWVMTGDMFYRDEEDYYYFTERKRLLIKYAGNWISPQQMEEVIKQHPAVSEACVVGIPDKDTTETPVGVIQRKPGAHVTPEDIFNHVKDALPALKQLHGGLYFLDDLPLTPSGKVHRAKLRDITLTAQRTFPK